MSDGIPIHVDDVPEQRWEVGELEATRKRLGAAANALRMGVAIIDIAPGGRSTPGARPRRRGRGLPRAGGLRRQLAVVGLQGRPRLRDRPRRRAPAPGPGRRAHADRRRRGAEGARGRRGLAHAPDLAAAREAVLGRPALVAGGHAAAVRRRRAARPARGPGAHRGAPADHPQPGRPAAQRGPREAPPTPPATRATWAPSGSCSPTTRCRRTPGTPTCTSTPRARSAGTCAAGAGSRGSAPQAHELRPGSFWLRRPNGGVGHRIEVGPEGMDLITMGDLVAGRRRRLSRAEDGQGRSRRGASVRPEGLTHAGHWEGKRTTGTNPFLVPGSMTPSEAQ